MVTAIAKSYDIVSLEDIEPGPEHDGRVPLNIRRHFGIQGFGVRANRAVGDGHVVGEHTEDGIGASGQEELYLVLSGKATFNVDGEPIYATAGTMVFVRDPAAQRSAIAKEEGTTILAIGGTPGKAYEPPPEEAAEAFKAYNEGDYETAAAKQLVVVEKRPNDAVASFNAACFEARAGKADEAIEHLQRAVELNDRIKELIRSDEDLDSIREDPRFDVLTK